MTQPSLIAATRFGYGLPLPKGAGISPQEMLLQLAGPDSAATLWPGLRLADVMPLHGRAYAARQMRAKDPMALADYRAALAEIDALTIQGQRVVVARALGAVDGFRERLVQFWTDHFTTIAKRPEARAVVMTLAEEAIRPNLTGPFAEMLKAATLHPAMLLYLDQQFSVGPNSRRGQRLELGLNENLARELLELHTLGVGAGYSQTDVRQMAELLTGVFVQPDKGQVFNPRAAEPGPEEVLGRVYKGRGLPLIERALGDLARRPETGQHLARKLAVHFVADDPPADLIRAMTAAYDQSGGDLLTVYAALLQHPAAWSAPLTKLRQPFDFVVAGLRGLGMTAAQLMGLDKRGFQRLVLNPMAAMGQPMNGAPGPDGWPEQAEAWITPQRLAARITWAMTVPGRLVRPVPEPAALAQSALGERASLRLGQALAGAETRRDAVGLVLSSPEFNRR